jgi:PAS domain S-box-containing protein
MTAQPPSLPDAIETVLCLAVQHETVATIADDQGTITYASHRFCEMTGFREDELIGKNCRCLAGLALAPAIDAILSEARAGKIWNGPLCLKGHQGCSCWTDASVISIEEDCGKQWFITLVTARDADDAASKS